MVLKQIDLLNFRLHKNTSINFSDSLNYIVGGNGQGKTSILEAIYYLCTTKNLNFASDGDAVSFGSEYFEARGRFSDYTENDARIFYDSLKSRKSYFLNEKLMNSSSEVIGKFPIVALIQSDHTITLGGPADRRKFIDSVISQSSETYLKILLEYNKTLRQRSSLLGQIREGGSSSLYSQLESWTKSLIINGAELIRHRLKFIGEFKNYISDAYGRIMTEAEIPEIVYGSIPGINEENAQDKLYEETLAQRDGEIRRAANLVGPHRDDYIFLINGNELKRYGSQGQHKTFQIALRFGQFFYMKDKLGKTPIFLMDDVFGELDTYRAGKISEYLSEVGQAFITMTDLTNREGLTVNSDSRVIKIYNGALANA